MQNLTRYPNANAKTLLMGLMRREFKCNLLSFEFM